jgi:hypothetical protein
MIFLDSSFLVAYSNEKDEYHEKAVKIAKEIDNDKYGTAVITDYIFDETMTTLLSRTGNFAKTIETGNKILDTVSVLNMDSSLFLEAWRVFKAQKKLSLSFTDCSIIAMCKTQGILTLVTFDRLLKEESRMNIVD